MLSYLSLFSGVGGFELGIQDAFPEARCLGYSEVDPYPIKVYDRNFYRHTALGPVEKVKIGPRQLDLMVGGWPCTDLSIGNVENLGLEGIRSGLIREAVRILREATPTWFCFENVASMKDSNRDAISKLLGVNAVMIDAGTVSAQRRERYFWANFPITQPQPVNVRLVDVLDAAPDPRLTLSEAEMAYMNRRVKGGRTHWDFGHHHDTNHDKAHCLPANLHKGVPYNVLIDRRFGEPIHRKLSPVEAERLMGFPEGHTEGISNSRRYKALGNSVSVPVMKHIFGCLRRRVEELEATGR